MATTKIDRIDFFGISLTYHHIGDSFECKDGSKMFRSSGYASSDADLKIARAKLVEMVEYYQAIDCQITTAIVTRFCSTCDATGHVAAARRGRTLKTKRCPACRGKDSEVIEETWIELPKELWI